MIPRKLPAFASLLFFSCFAACGGTDDSTTSSGAANEGQSTNAPAPGTTSGAPAGNDPGAPGKNDPSPSPSQSSGCSGTAGLGAGNNDVTITSGGRQRTARVHVPSSYDAKKPTPLVLDFHGRTSNASQQELISKATPKSDAAGFIVVYPEGIGQTWNGGLCCGEAQSSNIDDVGFTRDLLDELGKKLCVDPKRVFAMGLSNGAYMSHRLACDLSDRIAAIGPVAGGILVSSCKPTRAVPVMHFHGDADPIVSYEGAYGMPGAKESTKAWADRNGCTGMPKQTYSNGDTTCMTYSGCKDNADTTLCTISGGGHTWPGGFAIPGLGKTSKDIDATSQLWDFFVAHPMP